MLAWVRGAVVVMAAGCAVDRFAVAGSLPRSGVVVGPLLVCGGVLLAGAALIRLLAARARIESDRLESRVGADLALLALLGVGGIVVLVMVAR
jgi:uncharacterized membrane protein YidH (DUF202 family)